jgi:hypothetical protein
MAILILTIGGFHIQMVSPMLSLQMKVSGMILMMMVMETISNISMERLGEKLGEEMAVLLQKGIQQWIDGVAQIPTVMVGLTLLLIG